MKFKKLNNKGFAITSILYAMLLFALLLMTLVLLTISRKKMLVEKTKEEAEKVIDSKFYTIEYDCNGGLGEMPNSKIYTGINKIYYLRPNSCTNEKYRFKGWALSETGDVMYLDREQITDSFNIDNNPLIKLYAMFGEMKLKNSIGPIVHSDTSIKTNVLNDYVPVISVADENTIFVTYRGSYSNSTNYNYYINKYSNENGIWNLKDSIGPIVHSDTSIKTNVLNDYVPVISVADENTIFVTYRGSYRNSTNYNYYINKYSNENGIWNLKDSIGPIVHSDTSIKTNVLNDYVPVISVADENTIFVTYRGSYSNSTNYNYYINKYSNENGIWNLKDSIGPIVHSDTSIKTNVLNDYVPAISVADENTIFVTYRGSYSNSTNYNYYINKYSNENGIWNLKDSIGPIVHSDTDIKTIVINDYVPAISVADENTIFVTYRGSYSNSYNYNYYINKYSNENGIWNLKDSIGPIVHSDTDIKTIVINDYVPAISVADENTIFVTYRGSYSNSYNYNYYINEYSID